MRRLLVSVLFVLPAACGGASRVEESSDTIVTYVPTTAPSTTTDPAVPSPSEVGAALKLAGGALPRQATVPEPWIECCPPMIYNTVKLTEHECAAPADLPPHVAGMMRQFAHDLQPNGNEGGHFTAAVRVSRTAALAKQEWGDGELSPEYRSCQAADAGTKLSDRYGFDVSVDSLEQTYQRTELDLPVPAWVDSMTTEVSAEDGGGLVLAYSARALVGRAIVRTEFQMLVPYSVEEVRAILEPIIVRLIAAQA